VTRRGAARSVARVNRYVVSRTRAWHSEEELAAFTECAPAIAEVFKEHVRWIRSDIVREEDGTLSGVCVYDATSPEWLREYSEAAMLPIDSIRPLAATHAA
jgi:Protein of unknown function (DUF4242)